MKLIRQIALYLREPNADYVFEIDLCEVGPDQFVVNFRHGRLNTTLLDGSKTVLPVSRASAERIFENLVSLKRGAGYVVGESSARALQDIPRPTVSRRRRRGSQPASVREGSSLAGSNGVGEPAAVLDHGAEARAEAIRARLAVGTGGRADWKLTRAIWRAGELRLPKCEERLLALLEVEVPREKKPSRRAMLLYSLIWALGRCGSLASLPALAKLQQDGELVYPLRRWAGEAARSLMDAGQRTRAVEAYIDQLPDELAELARRGPASAFAAALNARLREAPPEAFAAIELCYFIDNEHTRPALLELLRSAPLAPNWFQRFRRVFKAAEMRDDVEVFAALARRFATTAGAFRVGRGVKARETLKGLQGERAQRAFGRETRAYFNRRAWRTLRRLGERGDAAVYTRWAAAVLAPYSDDDARAPRFVSRARWEGSGRNQRMIQVETRWDAFAHCWALNHILYHHSPRYRPDATRAAFRCAGDYQPGQAGPPRREDAFGALWNQHPQPLVDLLATNRCEIIHEFGVKVLRDCPEFCDRLPLADLIRLLAAPYPATLEFAFRLAARRYDPAAPDRALTLALADCAHAPARAQARAWIDAQPSVFFADAAFTAALAASPQADTRSYARGALALAPPSDDLAERVVARVLSLVLGWGEGEGERVADVAATLFRVFPLALRRLGLPVLLDLAGHPLRETQRLAADVLASHAVFAEQPPLELARRLLGSAHAAIRALAAQAIGRLSDDVLCASVPLLVALTRHPEPEARDAIRPRIQQLADRRPEFGRQLAEALLAELLTPGAPEGVPTHTSRVLREDLSRHLRQVGVEMVWRLLKSRSGPAQELGGALLAQNVSAERLEVAQIVELADHEILAVREAAWKMFDASRPRMPDHLGDAIGLLDSKWEDTRRFAAAHFRQRADDYPFTPNLLAGLCDSSRADVQQVGRELITRRFEAARGPEYLLKLAEHPAAAMQLFAASFLDQHAAGHPERIAALRPYFLSVLTRVNRGRVARKRALAFLEREGPRDEAAARIVVDILEHASATCSIETRAAAVATLAKLRAAFPRLPSPLRAKPVEARAGRFQAAGEPRHGG